MRGREPQTEVWDGRGGGEGDDLYGAISWPS